MASLKEKMSGKFNFNRKNVTPPPSSSGPVNPIWTAGQQQNFGNNNPEVTNFGGSMPNVDPSDYPRQSGSYGSVDGNMGTYGEPPSREDTNYGRMDKPVSQGYSGVSSQSRQYGDQNPNFYRPSGSNTQTGQISASLNSGPSQSTSVSQVGGPQKVPSFLQQLKEDDVDIEFSATFGTVLNSNPGPSSQPYKASSPAPSQISSAQNSASQTQVPSASFNTSHVHSYSGHTSYPMSGSMSELRERVVPSTPTTTPNIPTPSPTPIPVHSEEDRRSLDSYDINNRLVQQLQIEKGAHDLTKKKLDYFAEEKSLLLKEISTLKFQIDNLEKENSFLSQSLEQQNLSKTKTVNEFSRIQAALEHEKKHISSELEKEQNAQLELTIEISQLKSKLDQAHKLHAGLTSDLAIIRSAYEKDKVTKAQFESENIQFREHWGKIHQDLENEKTTKVALAREIQELKKQIKGFEPTQTAFAELTIKAELLDKQLIEEQSKRHEVERTYSELLESFNALDQKRSNFENLGVFSDKLMQSVPTFTAHVTEIAEKLSEHSDFLKAQKTEKESLETLFNEFRNHTQKEFNRQTQLLETALKTIQESISSAQHPHSLEVQFPVEIYNPTAEVHVDDQHVTEENNEQTILTEEKTLHTEDTFLDTK